jgi:hypothetical protein
MKEFGSIWAHPVSYREASYFKVRTRDEDIKEIHKALCDLAARDQVEFHGARSDTGVGNSVFGYLEGYRPSLITVQQKLAGMGWTFTPDL